MLYLVATPIGNLGDLTYRAAEVLKSVDWIACEDTRHSRGLLDHYGIRKPLFSYFDHSERQKAPELIRRLKAGENGALISDAGTPGISDPGYRLITGAIEAGVRVEALPGPSAILPALIVSGMPTDRFVFEGFAPVKDGARKKWLSELKGMDRTVVFYESPHRILKTLMAMREVLGSESRVAVVRELTKKFEEVRRESLDEAVAHFSAQKPLGEFVVVWSPER